MLRNYWYILAFSITVTMISMVLENFFLAWLFACWLIVMAVFKRVKLSLVLLAFVASIAVYFYIPSKEVQQKQAANINTDVETLSGNIVSPLTETEQTITFNLKTDDQQTLAIIYFKKNEQEHRPTTVKHGAFCQLSGKIAVPQKATNPHEFDYQNYLWQQGVLTQFQLASLDNLVCTDSSFLAHLYTFRDYLRTSTEARLSNETAQWLHALVLGDDSLLDNEVVDVFQRWGLSHILAISGLHIGIIVGLIYFCLVRFSVMTKEQTKMILCLFLPVYAFIAGGQPSVWRATFMVVIVAILSLLKRKLSYLDLISITFLLLILFDRYIIYQVGFQFSFLVTFGIILSGNWLRKSASLIENVFKISFVSQMVMLPLQFHYFSIFDPLSIVLNIIVVPYFSLFVIPAMFLFLLLWFLPEALTSFLQVLFQLIHQQMLSFIFWVDTHFHFPFIIGKMPLYFIIGYYVFFVLFMITLEKHSNKKAFLYGIVFSLYITFLALRPYFSPYGTVTMLDIGQGDTFVIEMPYRKGVYLVDVGAMVSFPAAETTDNVYRQVIRPYLYGQGIHSIDAVFISHEDIDHDGSLPYLLEEMHVEDIVISDYYIPRQEMVEAWRAHDANVTTVRQGDTIYDNEQQFHVLSPDIRTDSANENSMVLLTEIGGLSWVFTGDIGVETEQQILKNYPNLHANVLKVGHHGSNTSTDQAFAARFNDAAWISAGRNNRYGHPNKEVLTTLEEAELDVFRTDKDGAVQYRFKEEAGFFQSFLSQ